jgi:cation diffusion facilitator family transporter
VGLIAAGGGSLLACRLSGAADGQSEEAQGVSADGGKTAIIAALLANAGIAAAKFIGYLITGSSSILAEAVHSVADTSNQGLLLLGRKRAQRKATQEHPFGYGRDRYFYSFVVALLLFSLGSAYALYEGFHKLYSGGPIRSPLVAIGILAVAIVLESLSFRTAIRESRPLKGDNGWWQFIRGSKIPELPVVLLEDAGALIGLLLAFGGVGLSVLTGDSVWDGIGTLGISALLGVIAIILIVETKSLLIGEGSNPDELRRICGAMVGHGVDRVIHLKTQYLGPEELLIAAKIAVPAALSTAEVARIIDEAEARVRDVVPAARIIYLEPDLDRTPAGAN